MNKRTPKWIITLVYITAILAVIVTVCIVVNLKKNDWKDITAFRSNISITIEDAQKLALKKANADDKDVDAISALTVETGNATVYDISFVANNIKYSAKISSGGDFISWNTDTHIYKGSDGESIISEDEAINIALSGAKAKKDDVSDLKTELVSVADTRQYQITFTYENLHYSANISASNGRLISWNVR